VQLEPVHAEGLTLATDMQDEKLWVAVQHLIRTAVDRFERLSMVVPLLSYT
jgi:hypothetical protein